MGLAMLTDTAIKNAKPGFKPDTRNVNGGNPILVTGPYKMHDTKGLYLLVTVSGGKWWRVDYRFDGKRKTLSVGTYPTVPLSVARAARDAIKAQIEGGIDPTIQRNADSLKSKTGDTFEDIAREWHSKNAVKWSEGHTHRTIERLQKDVFPFIGSTSIGKVDAPTLLAVLRRMESRGVGETVLRVRENCGAIFRYGIATGRCTSNPADALRGAIVKPEVKHRSAIIEPKRLGELLRLIDTYRGTFIVRSAFKLSPLFALRPGEVRQIEWVDIHFDAAEIRIPGAKMKMKSDHIVPLSRQAIAILKDVYKLTGNGQYAFPNARTPGGYRPMSDGAINGALRRLGVPKDEMCAHGFRGSFSSLLNEKFNFSMDAIERQLAHSERNKVRRAYLHSEFLDERRQMMQVWADYLDQLRVGKTQDNVVQMRPTG